MESDQNKMPWWLRLIYGTGKTLASRWTPWLAVFVLTLHILNRPTYTYEEALQLEQERLEVAREKAEYERQRLLILSELLQVSGVHLRHMADSEMMTFREYTEEQPVQEQPGATNEPSAEKE